MVKLSVSFDWHDKKNVRTVDPEKAWVDFRSVDWPPEKIIGHISNGRTISVAHLKKNWRHSDNFDCAQIIGVDIDNGDPATSSVEYIARHDEFARKHAFMIYATPSSTPENPRSRILFALDAPVFDPDDYRLSVLKILALYETADPKCKDEVRIFHGSETDDVIAWPDHVLPTAVVESLPKPDDLYVPVVASAEEHRADGGDYSKEVETYVAVETTKLRLMRSGSRNDTVNSVAFRLGRLFASDWSGFTRQQAERIILNETTTSKDFTLREVQTAMRSGFDAGMRNPIPRPKKGDMPTRVKDVDQRRPEFGKKEYKPLNGAAQMGLPAEMPSLAEVSTHRKQAMADVVEGVRSGQMPVVRPVPNRIKAIEKFGGQAYALDRGNMAWLVGLSGGGKTIFWESMITPPLLDDGYVLVTSREWKPGKLAQREMQRRDVKRKFSVDDIRRHVIAQEEQYRGIPAELRAGRLMSDEQIAHMESVAGVVNSTRGDVIILEQKFGIDGLIHYIREFVDTYGDAARAVIIDYIQLEAALDVYRKRMDIVDICFYMKDELQPTRDWMGVPMWVASQVTKESAKAAKEGPYILTAQDGKNLRDDPANLALAITLQPIFNENGTIVGWKDVAIINVDKNSEGSKGVVAAGVDLERLRWVDEPINIR